MEKIHFGVSYYPLESSVFSSFCFSLTVSKIILISKEILLSYSLLIFNTFLGIYHFFRAYQFKWHTNSFLLDGDLKLIECKRLLKQIRKVQKNSPENISSLLQKCMSLCLSIKNKSCYGKEKFLFDFCIYYAEKNNLDGCFLIAENLSNIAYLLDLMKNIQSKNPSHPSLLPLCIRIFNLLQKENGFFFLASRLRQYLVLAEFFHSFKNQDYQTKSVNEALNIYNGFTGLEKLYAHLDMTKYYHKINDEDSVKNYINTFQDLGSFRGKEKSSAILLLIDAYASFKEYDKLNKIMEYLCENPNPSEQNIRLIAKLIKEHHDSNQKKSEHILNCVYPNYYTSYLTKTKEISDKTTKIKACINLIGSNNSCKFEDPNLEKPLDLALENIDTLPETSDEEILNKSELIFQITNLECFDEINKNKKIELVQKLEVLYSNCSNKDKQEEIGRKILQLYKKLEIKEDFLSTFLKNIEKDKDNCQKILWYYSLTNKDNDEFYCLDLMQKKQLLKKAEDLLLLVADFHYAKMASLIADAYLEIDSEKSLEILKEYETYRGNSCLATAAVYSFFAGAIYKFPYKSNIILQSFLLTPFVLKLIRN